MADQQQTFPNKEQRTRCYVARDEYYTCMDQHQGKDEETVNKLCSKQKTHFETECPTQWVSHFVRKYKFLKFKEKMESGYDPASTESDAKGHQ